MSEALVSAAFAIAGVVQLVPVAGAVSARRLASLYGVDVEDPALCVLLQHRAVLFGIVGGLLIAAAIDGAHRQMALLAGATSIISFLVLHALRRPANAKLRRVFWVDVVALLLLMAAAIVDGTP